MSVNDDVEKNNFKVFADEIDFISNSSNYYENLISKIPEVKPPVFIVKNDITPITNAGEILRLLNLAMIDGHKLSIKNASNNSMLGVSYITGLNSKKIEIRNTISNTGKSEKPKRISIGVQGDNIKYVFNCENNSDSESFNISLDVPLRVDCIESQLSLENHLKFTQATAVIYWLDLKVGFSGKINRISRTGVLLEFDRDLFNQSYYSQISSSISTREPMVMPLYVDLMGFKHIFTTSPSDIKEVDGRIFLVLRFLKIVGLNSRKLDGMPVGVKKLFSEIDDYNSFNKFELEKLYISVFGYNIGVSKTNIENNTMVLSLDDKYPVLDLISDSQVCICSYDDEFFTAEYVKKNNSFEINLVDIGSEKIGFEFGSTDALKPVIQKIVDENKRYNAIETSLSVINRSLLWY